MPHQKCEVWDLSPHCPKPVCLSLSRSRMASFAPGIHLGTLVTFSDPRRVKLLGAYSVVPLQQRLSQSVFPHRSPGWQQVPWDACGEGGNSGPCPSPHREAAFGRSRPCRGSHMICHPTTAQETLQACSLPTSLLATLAAPWFLLHLFGQQTPREALLPHSLQSPQAAGGTMQSWFQSCFCLL